MLVEILKLDENNQVVPGLECYTEPYLKAVLDNYKDPIPALCYLYYMTYPYSSYNNFSEEDREKNILLTYPGEYSTEDDVIIRALSELNKRYDSPAKRFFLSQKNTLDILAKYSSNLKVESINDDNMKGNLAGIKKTLLESKKLIDAYRALEDDYNTELQTRIRGGGEIAYDAKDKGF